MGDDQGPGSPGPSRERSGENDGERRRLGRGDRLRRAVTAVPREFPSGASDTTLASFGCSKALTLAPRTFLESLFPYLVLPYFLTQIFPCHLAQEIIFIPRDPGTFRLFPLVPEVSVRH